MKIRIYMKDPDGVYDSITDAVGDSLREQKGLTDAERKRLEDIRRETINSACSRWIQWGEDITIEIDTDADTATVVPR